MSRLIHFIARLYPRSWRERYGAEFAALLEDVRPDGRTAANVLAGALAMHIRAWKSWKILAASAGIAAAVVVGLFVAIPNSYVSRELIKFEWQPDGRHRVDVKRLSESVESYDNLTELITVDGLYPKQRSRMPMADVVGEMRRNISISPPGSHVPGIAIGFNYSDPRVAQKVTRELASRFLNENLRQPQGVNLQILDPASLPQSPFYPSKPVIIGFGIACFLLMWGALSAWRSVSARRYAAAGSSFSSSGYPIGNAMASGSTHWLLRRNTWIMLAAVVLLLAAVVLTFSLAESADVVETYESSAVVKVASQAVSQVTADYLVSLDQSVESGDSLSRIITTYNLYPGRRSREAMEDVIEVMKKSIRIEPFPKGSKNATALVVRFVYDDP